MVAEVSPVVTVGGSVGGMVSDAEVGGSVGSSVESSSVEVGPGGFSSTHAQTDAAASRISGTGPRPHPERMHGRAVARILLEDSGVQRPVNQPLSSYAPV